MVRIDPKAEISPATAAIVVILVLALAAFSLWYFVFYQPGSLVGPPNVGPNVLGPSGALEGELPLPPSEPEAAESAQPASPLPGTPP